MLHTGGPSIYLVIPSAPGPSLADHASNCSYAALQHKHPSTAALHPVGSLNAGTAVWREKNDGNGAG